MPQSQVNFAAFAAAFVCPPPAVNDAAPAVTALAVSGQGVGTISSWTPSRQLSCFEVSGGYYWGVPLNVFGKVVPDVAPVLDRCTHVQVVA